MVNRQELITAMKEVYSPDEIQKTLNYNVSEKDCGDVASIALEILKAIPRIPSQCASMSGYWGQKIKSQTSIPVCVVTGHLTVAGAPLFTQKTPLDLSEENDGIDKIWDGHCWIEFGGYIGDISIFRTVFSQNFPHPNFKKWFIDRFDQKEKVLFANYEIMASLGLLYTPMNVLTDANINVLSKDFIYLSNTERTI